MIFDGDRAWLEPYIRQLQRMTGLAHWRIDLIEDAPNDGCSATTEIHRVYLRAKMRLRDPDEDTYGTPEETVRQVVTHELVHIHLHDWSETVDGLEDHLNPAALDIVNNVLYRAMERSVDAIATAWAGTLPLPVINDVVDEEAA